MTISESNKEWIENNCQLAYYVTVFRNNIYDTIGAVYCKFNEDRPNTWYYIGLDVNNESCVKLICDYQSEE